MQFKMRFVQSGVVVLRHQTLETTIVRAIGRRQVGYDSVVSALDYCESNHESCSQLKKQYNLGHMGLIDCVEKIVVMRDASEQCFALSYVWRPTPDEREQLNEQMLEQQDFSIEAASLTVQSATIATRRLGRRHLWVDEYCIAQHAATAEK